MARFSPGDLVYHDYGEPVVVYHERLVLCHVDQLDYVICTPDRDVYVETLDGSNPDLASFHVGLPGGVLPPAIAGGRVYGFGAIAARDYNQLLQQGRVEAQAERGRRGLAALAAAPPVAVAADQVWVLAEMVRGHKIGEEITPNPNQVNDGDWGLHRMTDSEGKARVVLVAYVRKEDLEGFCEERIQLCRDSESLHGEDTIAGDDSRTLSIKYGVNGERSRTVKESVQEMRVTEFDDFPFTPRTTAEYMRAVTTVAESCLSQHNMWVTQSGIPSGDRSIYEDDCLARVLDYAVKFDGLNIMNLASFELIIRRRQLIAEAHSHTPGAPSYEAAEHFLQTGYRPGGAIVVPSLQKYVAEKLHQDGQILKERRKLREERGAGRGRGKPGKTTNPGQDQKQ